jgi:hypothetical protein
VTRRVVVTPAPLPPPFRAATRRSRLVADEAGLHWTSARGRTRSWARGPNGPATVRVLSAARARGAAGLPAGPLVVVGDAAERPLLVIPAADWNVEPLAPGRGDPLRGTGLRPLVEALDLAVRPVTDDAVRAASAAPVARAVPRWTAGHSVAISVGALATAVGTVLGIARGESTTWATVGLIGVLLLLVAGAGAMVTGLVGERRTGEGWVAEVRPGSGRRRLLLARRDHGLEIGVRADDGVEHWLPVGDHPAAVATVRTKPGAVELVDPDGAVLQELHAARWLTDDADREALGKLCAEAGLPLRSVAGRNRVLPPDLGSDLPLVSATWPRLLPRTDLLAWIGGFFGAFNGAALLRGADGPIQQWLAAGYLGVGVVGLLLWLAVRRS